MRLVDAQGLRPRRPLVLPALQRSAARDNRFWNRHYLPLRALSNKHMYGRPGPIAHVWRSTRIYQQCLAPQPDISVK